MIRKTLRILRRRSPEDEPHYEEFTYETEEGGATVATALMEIGPSHDIAWEHSCLQKKCGACAMIIDGKPALACDTRLADCRADTVTLEPLRKFPVVRDLLVDRSSVTDRLRELRVYPAGIRPRSEKAPNGAGPGLIDRMQRDDETAVEAFRCIQCCLCLEVCPNYYREGTFSGMAAMAPMARLMAQGSRRDLKKSYRRAVYEGCGKSLACRDICPAGLDMDMLLSRSNRRILFS